MPYRTSISYVGLFSKYYLTFYQNCYKKYKINEMSKNHQKGPLGSKSDSKNYPNERIIQNRHALVEAGKEMLAVSENSETAKTNLINAFKDKVRTYASKEIKYFLDMPTSANEQRVLDRLLKEEINFLSSTFSRAEFTFEIERYKLKARLDIESAAKIKAIVRTTVEFFIPHFMTITYVPNKNTHWATFKVELKNKA
jgi:hypothetical protein